MFSGLFVATLLVGVATAGRITLEHVNTIGDGRLRHPNDILGLIPLKDGKRLLTFGGDWTARLWEIESGKQLTLMSHVAKPGPALLLPDEKHLLTSMQNRIYLWDIETGAQKRSFRIIPHVVFLVLGTRPGEFVSSDGTVWNWETGEKVRILGREEQDKIGPRKGLPAPNGAPFHVEHRHQRITMLRTGVRTRVLWEYPVAYHVDALAWSPDGKLVATAHRDGEIWLLDARNGAVVRKIKIDKTHFWDHRRLVFSPDGKRIYSAGTIVHIHEVASGRQIFPDVDRLVSNEIVSLAVRGERLYSLNTDVSGTRRNWVTKSFVDEWDLGTGMHRARLKYEGARVYAMALSPDGLVVTASADGEVMATDPATNKRVWRAANPNPETQIPYAILFLDQRRFVVMGGEGAQIHELGSDKEPRLLHRGLTLTSQLSPDRKTFATTHVKTIRLWSASTGELIREFSYKFPHASGVWFSRDGRRLMAYYGATIYAVSLVPEDKDAPGPGERQSGGFEKVGGFGQDGTIGGVVSPKGDYWVSVSRRYNSQMVLGRDREGAVRVLARRATPDVPHALAWGSEGDRFYVGNMKGTIDVIEIVHHR